MKLHKEHISLPGTERYTQPEEIKALSKFLRQIKEIQEEHTKLEEDNLIVPGDKENPNLSDTSIPRIPHEITSLPEGPVLPVENVPKDPELPGNIETIKDHSQISKLEEHREDIMNHGDRGLETRREDIKTNSEENSLEDMVLEINSGKDPALEDERLDIRGKRDVDLEDERLDINTTKSPSKLPTSQLSLPSKTKNISSLPKDIETIKSKSKNLPLESHLETIEKSEDINLEDIISDLKVTQDVDLPKENNIKLPGEIEDTDLGKENVKLKDTSDPVSLEEGIININAGQEIELTEDKIDLEGPVKDLALENYREEIEAENETLDLSKESVTLGKTRDIESLSENIEIIKATSEVNLEDKSVSLESPSTEISLSEGLEILKTSKEEPALVTESVTLKSPEEINLQETTVHLKVGEDQDLKEGSITLPGEITETDLETSIRSLDTDYKIDSLPEDLKVISGVRENNLAEKIIPLESGDNIEDLPSDVSLKPGEDKNIEGLYGEETRESITPTTEVTLEDILEDLKVDDKVDGLQSNYIDLGVEDKIEALPEDSKTITVNPLEELIGNQIKRPSEGERTIFGLRDTGNGNLEPTKTPEDFEAYQKSSRGEDIKPRDWETTFDENGRIPRPKNADNIDRTITSGIEDSEFWKKRNVTNEVLESTTDFEDYLGSSKQHSSIRPEVDEDYLSKEIRIRIDRPDSAEDIDRTTTDTAKGFNAWFSKLSPSEQEDWKKNHTPPVLDEGKIIRPQNSDSGDRTITNLQGDGGNQEPLETPEGFKEYTKNQKKSNKPGGIQFEGGKVLRPNEGDRTITNLQGDGGNLEPVDTPEGFKEYTKNQKKSNKPGGIQFDGGKVIRPDSAEDIDRTTTDTAKGFNAWFSKLSDEEKETWIKEHEGLLHLDEGKVSRPKNAEDGDKTTTSTAKGFNAWLSKLSDEERKKWEESRALPTLDFNSKRVLRPKNADNIDRTITSGIEDDEFWKSRNVTNDEPLETPEGFKEYLEGGDKSRSGRQSGRREGGKVLMPNISGRTLTSQENGLKANETELNRDIKIEKDNWKKNLWGKRDQDIPHYQLPEIGWKNFWDGGALNISTYLRWAAENTIGRVPLRGVAKQKLIDETLHFLVWGREALEKVSKSNRDRLPGNDMGILSTLVRGTNVKEAATQVLSAVGKAASKSVNHADPINRPELKKIESEDENGETITSKEVRQSVWVAPGQEVLDYTQEKDNSKASKKKGFWGKLGSNLIGGSNNDVPDNQKRRFSDYVGNEYVIGQAEGDNTSGIGIGITLQDLIPKSSEVTNLEEFKTALRSSRFITTPEKFTSTKNYANYMTLDSNHVWEIFFRPYAGEMNGNRTWLPSFLEIDYQNKQAFNYTTYYSRGWLPITGFELQEKKLTSKDLPLFDGSISYPVSMEFTNELRLTFADDSLKSLKRYFDLCAKVSAYMSNIHYSKDVTKEIIEERSRFSLEEGGLEHYNVGYSVVTNEKETIYDKPIDQVKEIKNPTIYLEGKIHPGLYKNLSFLVSLYVLTPQYGTVKKCNLLCVLKDYTIDNQGEIDSSPTELNVTFSIVGENPIDTPDLGEIKEGYKLPKRLQPFDRTGTGILDNLGGVMSVF